MTQVQLTRFGRILVVFVSTILTTMLYGRFYHASFNEYAFIFCGLLSLFEFISDFDSIKSWIMKKKKAVEDREINKQKKAYNVEISKLRSDIFLAHADKNALYENMEFALHKHEGSEEEKEKMTADFVERLSTFDFEIDTLKQSLEIKQTQLEQLSRDIMLRDAVRRVMGNTNVVYMHGTRGNGRTYNREALLQATRLHDALEDAQVGISIQHRMRDIMDGIVTVDTTREGLVIRDGHHRMNVLRSLNRNNNGDLDFTFEEPNN